MFEEGFGGVRFLIIEQLENEPLTGTPEDNQRVLELVRRLQTLKGVKRSVQVFVHSGRLAEETDG